MVEKDIENLLASYIEEFLPSRKLVLIGQQIQLGGYRADLVFQEGPKTKLVIEVKRGLLMDTAIGQIGKYYGLLRQANPSEDIKMILAANVIPKELAIFMKEKMNIESLEIPISQINKVASKHSYGFSDAETPDQRSCNKELIKHFVIRSDKSRVWIFQTNPQKYDIINALADERIKEDVWQVNQHKYEIKKGDLGLIWMSGKEAGIYAVIDIISDPEFLVESQISAQYWTGEADKLQHKLRVKYIYKLKFINSPVYKQQLKNIPELSNLSILRRVPQGTNFTVTDKEWVIISKMIEKKYE
jgi:predicted RNA-binding protein with PUA-like domain